MWRCLRAGLIDYLVLFCFNQFYAWNYFSSHVLQTHFRDEGSHDTLQLCKAGEVCFSNRTTASIDPAVIRLNDVNAQYTNLKLPPCPKCTLFTKLYIIQIYIYIFTHTYIYIPNHDSCQRFFSNIKQILLRVSVQNRHHMFFEQW